MSAKRPPPVPPRRPKNRVAGKYELLEEAGRGGMSTVWRAHQHGPGRFRRTVAAKQMYQHLAEQPLYREMFFEEARVGSVLQDPNIAQVYDFLIDDDSYYLIVEWVDGIDLFTYIDYVVNRAGRQTRWDLMVAVTIGMLRGLSAAHERQDESGSQQPIVHRDVTPHNVLISIQGTAKLIDFGLSLARDRDEETTDPGIAKGKLAYLAPEVVHGARPTPASDQFAAGAVLWEALVGKRLFGEPNQYDTLRRIARADVPPLPWHRPDVPGALAETVHRALSLDPEDRFPSVRAMAKRLGAVLASADSVEDTYAMLGRTVRTARADLRLGRRTQGRNGETPVPEEKSGLVELPSDEIRPAGVRGWIPALLKGLKK